MVEPGTPSLSLSGRYRIELDFMSGAATVIYDNKEVRVILPDSLTVRCDNMELVANQIANNADAILLSGHDVSVMAENTNVTSSITIITGDITVNGNTVINGSLSINGDLTCDGNIKAAGDIIAGDVSLKHHIHGDVMSGGSNTSEPI